MPHVFAGTFQKARRIAQRRAVEEADVYVSRKGVDVSKRRVLHTCDGAAIVHELADVGAAVPHVLKPGLRDPSQFVSRLAEPSIDLGVPMDRTGEPKEPGQSRPKDLKLA
jgi:hypothetical protein